MREEFPAGGMVSWVVGCWVVNWQINSTLVISYEVKILQEFISNPEMHSRWRPSRPTPGRWGSGCRAPTAPAAGWGSPAVCSSSGTVRYREHEGGRTGKSTLQGTISMNTLSMHTSAMSCTLRRVTFTLCKVV